jgi:hypothetical protein
MTGMETGFRMELRQVQLSPYHGALELYEASEKIDIEVPLGRKKMVVPAAIADADDLQGIFGDERYAGTIGGMFFVTRQSPEEYRRFEVFHELAEHAAPMGLDVTGLAKHFQAIALELGYAKNVLSPEEYGEYAEWRRSIERTDFFRLDDDGLIDSISGRIKEVFDSLPSYLTYRRRKLVEVIED